MATGIARMRVGVRIAGILLAFLAARTDARAEAIDKSATDLPAGSVPAAPAVSGPVRTSDWLPGSPAAADSAAAASAAADSAAADSVAAASAATDPAAEVRHPATADSAGFRSETPRPDISPGLAPAPASSGAGLIAESSGASNAADRFLRLPPNTATGVSLGYPAYPGLFIVAPADGPFAFRSGLTGFPTIGLLWTPGVEYRFGQERGTASRDGVYAFGNAFLGRSYLDRDEHEYTGVEAGFGYRWLIDDRRDIRWIAALETGGYWRGDPVQPRHLCLRFIWTLIE